MPPEESVIKAHLANSVASESNRSVRATPLGDPVLRLELYALRRQAEEGPCKEAAPWPWDVVAHTKWTVWSQLADMNKFEAMRLYCCTVEEHLPQWWERRNELGESTSVAHGARAIVVDDALLCDMEDTDSVLYQPIKDACTSVSALFCCQCSVEGIFI
eukprot:NODE_19979_length_819_cov_12.119942.p1 GENE.NODE_19979_length_819_cov_12.119942~~NODE_19979_length_819_cov_12.119942.p1  ORF type:complete len:159 (+),score=18.49 NODE_19979_length_819_cov_12.119942:113-589(+)